MEVGATWDSAIPPIPDDARIFNLCVAFGWVMLFVSLLLFTASAGSFAFLFISDDPSSWTVWLPTSVLSGILGRFSFRFWISSRDRVAVSDNGIWKLRKDGSCTYMDWREVAEVRAHDRLQRLVLSDAAGTKAIRLEYQLRDFESLRTFVLARTSEFRRMPPGTSDFHRDPLNKVVILLLGVLFLLPTLQINQRIVSAPLIVSVALGAFWFARVVLDPMSLSIHSNEIVIAYPGWNRAIPLASVRGISLADVHDRGNVWVSVAIELQGKKSIQMPHFREGSVALYDGLLRACQSAGVGIEPVSPTAPENQLDERDLDRRDAGPEPISSSGNRFRRLMVTIGIAAASVALALLVRGRIDGRAVHYPRHHGAIATKADLVGYGQIYLVQMGEHTAAYSLEDFATWLHSKYDLDVRVLPAMEIDNSAWNPKRHQYIAELLYRQIKESHRDLATAEDSYLIGFTDADMYSVNNAWQSSFTQRDSMRAAVISTDGLNGSRRERAKDPKGTNDRFQGRLRRILLKDVAVLYWHLNVNNDPTSLLHDTLDPDLPTEDIYKSDLNPALAPAGERVEEPCLFLIYSVKSGLTLLPGSPVRDCTRVPDLIQDESAELFEVDLRLGLLLDKHTDFYLPDVLPIAFERVTRDGWPANHPMGRSGTDSYDVFLCATDDALNGMQIVNADGGRTNFVRYPSWVPVKWLVKFVDRQGQFIALRKNPSEHFTLKDISGGTHTYLNCPTSDQRCFFAGYRDALGRELRIDRDATRSLLRVTSPNGNWIHVKHGLKGRIEEIVDSHGRKVRYNYDEGNRLTAVVYPSGEVFRYVYDDTEHLLAFSVAADASSTPRVLLANEYMHGLLVRQTIANKSVYEYTYEANPPDQIHRATVHIPNGRTFRIDVTDAFSVIHEESTEAH